MLVDGVGTLSAGSFSGAPRGTCKACKKTGDSTGAISRVASGIQTQKKIIILTSQKFNALSSFDGVRESKFY